MTVLGWILFGFVVGMIARILVPGAPGRHTIGLIGTTILGILGAIAAGWIGQAAGWYQPGDSASFVSATFGAVLVLLIYHGIRGATLQRRARRAQVGKEDETTGMAA